MHNLISKLKNLHYRWKHRHTLARIRELDRIIADLKVQAGDHKTPEGFLAQIHLTMRVVEQRHLTEYIKKGTKQ